MRLIKLNSWYKNSSRDLKHKIIYVNANSVTSFYSDKSVDNTNTAIRVGSREIYHVEEKPYDIIKLLNAAIY